LKDGRGTERWPFRSQRPQWFSPCTRKFSIASVVGLKPANMELRSSVRMLPGRGGREVVF